MADNPITDPTGGAPNFNIEDVFKSFGYTPTQAEINALAPAFQVGTNTGTTGTSAVANYVIAHQQLAGAQSQIQGNLLSEQQAANANETLSNILEQHGEDAYKSASDIFTKAPQLFGSLTSDQVNTYLAPLKTQFDYATGATEGASNARGLAGSSINAAAQATGANQFKQSVLQAGLSVGQTQQQQQAALLQSLGQSLFGASASAKTAGVNYSSLANTSAGQNATLAGDISGLSGSAVNQALIQNSALRALNPKTQSFGDRLLNGVENSLISDVNSVVALPAGVINKLGIQGSQVTPTGAPTSGVSPTGASGLQGASSAADYTSGLEAAA